MSLSLCRSGRSLLKFLSFGRVISTVYKEAAGWTFGVCRLAEEKEETKGKRSEFIWFG